MDAWCCPGSKDSQQPSEATQAVEVGTSNCSPGCQDPRPAGCRSWPQDQSPVLSEPVSPSVTWDYCPLPAGLGEYLAQWWYMAQPVNSCQRLHGIQRPQETRGGQIMVERGSRGDDRLLASPLGVAADLCGGLRSPWSHRVAAGSTPSPTSTTQRGLYPGSEHLSPAGWAAPPSPHPAGCPPGLGLLKPTQRLVCPCRASLASEDPVHREPGSSKGSWGGFAVCGKGTARP